MKEQTTTPTKTPKRVPKLRFPEFSCEWENKKLNDITTKISDGIHSTPNYDENGTFYFVNGNNLIDGNIVIFDNTKKLSEQESKNHNRVLTENTILLSINGTIGNLAFYNNENIVIGKSSCYINIKSEFPKYFFYSILQSSKVRNYFNSELTGSTIKNLSLKTIKDTIVSIPQINEQQKIATFLSSVDKKISKLQQKQTLLEQYKKGVMQQLFSQKLRFKDDNGNEFPDWEEKRLGEVCEMTSSKRVYLSDYVEDGIPFYRGKEITELKNNKVPSDILFISEKRYDDYKIKYGVPKKNDILITAVGTLGNVLRIRNDEKFYFKDGNLIWLRNITENSLFLEILIQWNTDDLIKTSIGSTQKALTMIELRKLLFSFPCIKEQTKIANFLSANDKKIALVKTQIENTQQFKKGLLQHMFV